jgi:hypothetical protein
MDHRSCQREFSEGRPNSPDRQIALTRLLAFRTPPNDPQKGRRGPLRLLPEEEQKEAGLD